MIILLKHTGTDDRVLKMIPAIIETCRICRLWVRPGPRNKLTVRISIRFNEAVQFDLLFYDTYIVVHLIDECIRWSALEQVDNRDEDTLMTAVMNCWIRHYGAMNVIIMDGEKGLASDSALTFFDHHGIARIQRAPEQHAQTVEKAQ